MASPQKENGYTPIANELLEAFVLCKLPVYEIIVVLFIWRKTYGFSKREDRISNSQFVFATGIRKGHISRTLRSLKEKKIVTSTGNKLCVNKNYNEWKVTSRGYKVTSTGNNSYLHRNYINKKQLTKTISRQKSANNMKKNSFNYNENRHTDSYEDIVDFDTGEVVKKQKVKSHVLDVFQLWGKYPLNWKINKTQRASAENLFKERGLKNIRGALAYYQDNKEEKFCPVIHSPYDLDSKWKKLSAFRNKNGN